jgi:hypothetical protein
MISRCETWSALALSTAAVPATSVAKGWASLMSSYDVPVNLVKGSDSTPPAIDDSSSAPSRGLTAD